MAKAVIRRIIVDGRPFLWRRGHRHVDEEGQRRCEERLTIFAEGRKSSPLRVFFRASDEWDVGELAAGILWSQRQSTAYNLNRPAVVSAILAHMLRAGWGPDTSSKPLDVLDGFAILDVAGVPAGFR